MSRLSSAITPPSRRSPPWLYAAMTRRASPSARSAACCSFVRWSSLVPALAARLLCVRMYARSCARPSWISAATRRRSALTASAPRRRQSSPTSYSRPASTTHCAMTRSMSPVVTQSSWSEGNKKSWKRAVAMSTAPLASQSKTGSRSVRAFHREADCGRDEQQRPGEPAAEHRRVPDDRVARVVPTAPPAAASMPRAASTHDDRGDGDRAPATRRDENRRVVRSGTPRGDAQPGRDDRARDHAAPERDRFGVRHELGDEWQQRLEERDHAEQHRDVQVGAAAGPAVAQREEDADARTPKRSRASRRTTPRRGTGTRTGWEGSRRPAPSPRPRPRPPTGRATRPGRPSPNGLHHSTPACPRPVPRTRPASTRRWALR